MERGGSFSPSREVIPSFSRDSESARRGLRALLRELEKSWNCLEVARAPKCLNQPLGIPRPRFNPVRFSSVQCSSAQSSSVQCSSVQSNSVQSSSVEQVGNLDEQDKVSKREAWKAGHTHVLASGSALTDDGKRVGHVST